MVQFFIFIKYKASLQSYGPWIRQYPGGGGGARGLSSSFHWLFAKDKHIKCPLAAKLVISPPPRSITEACLPCAFTVCTKTTINHICARAVHCLINTWIRIIFLEANYKVRILPTLDQTPSLLGQTNTSSCVHIPS